MYISTFKREKNQIDGREGYLRFDTAHNWMKSVFFFFKKYQLFYAFWSYKKPKVKFINK